MGVQFSVEKRDCGLADMRTECPAHEGVSLLRCPHSLRGNVSPCARHIIYGYFFLSGSDRWRWCIQRMPGGEPEWCRIRHRWRRCNAVCGRAYFCRTRTRIWKDQEQSFPSQVGSM